MADSQERHVVSKIDEKDRQDLLVQEIIDDIAGTAEGRSHSEVVTDLTDRIAAEGLPSRAEPWLDAVASAAISGNAYVVSATTAAAADIPKPSTHRSGETID